MLINAMQNYKLYSIYQNQQDFFGRGLGIENFCLNLHLKYKYV